MNGLGLETDPFGQDGAGSGTGRTCEPAEPIRACGEQDVAHTPLKAGPRCGVGVAKGSVSQQGFNPAALAAGRDARIEAPTERAGGRAVAPALLQDRAAAENWCASAPSLVGYPLFQ